MKSILKCTNCGKYTMKEKCDCGGKPISIRPPRFSIEDAYGKYRRKVKSEKLKKEGLI